ncbi:MAG: competence/damage-inducible protein A, partial [Terriglobales bacterium]
MTGAFGLILIGDELLSGKRGDKHFAWVVSTLNQRGLKLGWCRILGDDDVRLTAVLRESFAGDDIVFSCGGIGATPDDRTRACAAAALGVPLEPHPEGTRLIEARYGQAARPQRVRMAEFPRGARPIPNPVNNVPGFS